MIQLRMYKFVPINLYLHYNIDKVCEYIIFVGCLYWVKNNQQATGDQHSDVTLGLTLFFKSLSKPD